MLYPIDQRAECVEAVAHESRIFCGLSFDFPLDLSGVAFTDAVRILPEHCRKAGAVLHFADVHAKAAANVRSCKSADLLSACASLTGNPIHANKRAAARNSRQAAIPLFNLLILDQDIRNALRQLAVRFCLRLGK